MPDDCGETPLVNSHTKPDRIGRPVDALLRSDVTVAVTFSPGSRAILGTKANSLLSSPET
tara:strand:- start:276 stop:455 length:180 start_codon:yes stop_codon:yes gene_type:complete